MSSFQGKGTSAHIICLALYSALQILAPGPRGFGLPAEANQKNELRKVKLKPEAMVLIDFV